MIVWFYKAGSTEQQNKEWKGVQASHKNTSGYIYVPQEENSNWNSRLRKDLYLSSQVKLETKKMVFLNNLLCGAAGT